MEQNWSRYKLGISLLVSLLTMASIVTVVWGQPIKQLTINYIEASAIPGQFANQVRAYVTVSDVDENPILGLSASDFEALEDGQEIVIDEVSQATDPMAIVLAIDTSGSMQARDASGQTSIDAAKRAAVDFISMLAQDDQVALFSFDEEPILRLDFSVDHGATINAVNALSAKEGASTCLYDTAFEAVKKAAEFPRGRRAIILLTDGKDETLAGPPCSTHTLNDVIDIATTRTIRVPIYTVGVGPKVDAQELGRIASLTGGRNLLATSSAELAGFYQRIANQLKNQYVVKYTTQAPSGEHSLVIKVRHEGSQGQDEKRFWVPPLPVARPPTVSFVSPTSADQIRGTVTVRVSITPEEAVAKVRYYVDGALKEEYTTAPFDTFNWDTAGLSSGIHVLRIEAVDFNGQIGSAEMTINVTVPTATPMPTATPTPIPGGVGPTSTIVCIVVLLLLLGAIAGGAVWWLRRRQVEEVEEPWPAEEGIWPGELEEMIGEEEKETEDTTGFEEGEIVTMDVKGEAPLATLTVVKSLDLEPGETFEIIGTTKLGRSSRNDIHIPDQPVSREHAEIYFDGSTFYIRDLGSKYGTKVDGRSVSAVGTSLYDGAQIQLGTKTILEFHFTALREESEEDEVTRDIADDHEERTQEWMDDEE